MADVYLLCQADRSCAMAVCRQAFSTVSQFTFLPMEKVNDLHTRQSCEYGIHEYLACLDIDMLLRSSPACVKDLSLLVCV